MSEVHAAPRHRQCHRPGQRFPRAARATRPCPDQTNGKDNAHAGAPGKVRAHRAPGGRRRLQEPSVALHLANGAGRRTHHTLAAPSPWLHQRGCQRAVSRRSTQRAQAQLRGRRRRGRRRRARQTAVVRAPALACIRPSDSHQPGPEPAARPRLPSLSQRDEQRPPIHWLLALHSSQGQLAVEKAHAT